MEPWDAAKKTFSQCGGATSSCPGSQPKATCPECLILRRFVRRAGNLNEVLNSLVLKKELTIELIISTDTLFPSPGFELWISCYYCSIWTQSMQVEISLVFCMDSYLLTQQLSLPSVSVQANYFQLLYNWVSQLTPLLIAILIKYIINSITKWVLILTLQEKNLSLDRDQNSGRLAFHPSTLILNIPDQSTRTD